MQVKSETILRALASPISLQKEEHGTEKKPSLQQEVNI